MGNVSYGNGNVLVRYGKPFYRTVSYGGNIEVRWRTHDEPLDTGLVEGKSVASAIAICVYGVGRISPRVR